MLALTNSFVNSFSIIFLRHIRFYVKLINNSSDLNKYVHNMFKPLEFSSYDMVHEVSVSFVTYKILYQKL